MERGILLEGGDEMTYEKIIVSKENGCEKLKVTHLIDHHVGEKEIEEYLQGTIVEIHRSLKEELAVTIFTSDNQVRLLHTRGILFTEVDGIEDNRMVSVYEVLWAAGIRLSEETLMPVVDSLGETSMKGVYYIQTAQMKR